MNDKVDILLATYQGEKFLREQLDSILNQTYSHFNILIRDDLSEDRTPEIINEYISKFPNKIILVPSKKKLGVKGNFSELMKQSSSDYMMLCDQDDVWLPNKVEASLIKMKEGEAQYGKNRPILIHTDLQVVNDDLSPINTSFWKFANLNPNIDALNRLLVQNVVTGCTTMFNKPLRDLAYPIPDDCPMHDWWLALVAKGCGQLIPIHQGLILYRQHQSSTTGNKKYNLVRLVKTFFSGYNSSIPSIQSQAREFQRRYQELLQGKEMEVVNAFCKLQNSPFLLKKYRMVKHQFFKQGLWRNLFLLKEL